MTEVVTPGETATPPVAPADGQSAPAPQPASPGTEPDINPDGQQPGQPAMVPSDRLREETEKRRQAEQELEELRNAQQTPPPTQNDDDDLDPEVEDLIRKGAKKLGLVSQKELDDHQTVQQVQQDVKALEATPPIPGIPYNHKEVMEHANANNLPITSKNALIAAYRDKYWDRIGEAERNKAIDGYKTNGGGGEKPGPTGPTPPSDQEVTGKSPKERVKSRIALARQKLTS